MGNVSAGVYENGKVEAVFLSEDGSKYGQPVYTDIATWRAANEKVESLAKLAGV